MQPAYTGTLDNSFADIDPNYGSQDAKAAKQVHDNEKENLNQKKK